VALTCDLLAGSQIKCPGLRCGFTPYFSIHKAIGRTGEIINQERPKNKGKKPTIESKSPRD
jgi:hypothetical protein